MNYQKMLLDLINTLDYKPKVLLHSCCGPCSTTCLEILKDYFDITIFYYNPNIEPYTEYLKRKKEQKRLIEEANWPIKFLDCDYDNEAYKLEVDNIKQEKEGGPRCSACYKLRLEKTALKAKKLPPRIDTYKKQKEKSK